MYIFYTMIIANAVNTLRDIRVKVKSDIDCVSAWNSGGLNIFYSSSMICGGGDNLPTTCHVSQL